MSYMIKKRGWIPKKETKRAYKRFNPTPNVSDVFCGCDYEDLYDEDEEEVFYIGRG